jgi:hypothetical protein
MYGSGRLTRIPQPYIREGRIIESLDRQTGLVGGDGSPKRPMPRLRAEFGCTLFSSLPFVTKSGSSTASRHSKMPSVRPKKKHTTSKTVPRQSKRTGNHITRSQSSLRLSQLTVKAEPILPARIQQYALCGEKPTFNDWNQMAVDHIGKKVYIFGGCRSITSMALSADLSVCDMQELRWTNLTVSLSSSRSFSCSIIGIGFAILRE